jgi:hypothetical protein
MKLPSGVLGSRCPVCAALVAVLCLVSGCGRSGPELGRVSGKVTLDGKPVPNAFITFEPQFQGRPSTTKSDKNGNYELQFNPTQSGALVGKHHVRVSTEDQTSDGRNIPELIPEAYRGANGFIPVTVESGRNVINLELKSGGGK